MSLDKEADLRAETDFDFLLTFLPPEWERKAKELGAGFGNNNRSISELYFGPP